MDGPSTQQKAHAHKKRAEKLNKDMMKLETTIHQLNSRLKRSKRIHPEALAHANRLLERTFRMNQQERELIVEAMKKVKLDVEIAPGEADPHMARTAKGIPGIIAVSSDSDLLFHSHLETICKIIPGQSKGTGQIRVNLITKTGMKQKLELNDSIFK